MATPPVTAITIQGEEMAMPPVTETIPPAAEIITLLAAETITILATETVLPAEGMTTTQAAITTTPETIQAAVPATMPAIIQVPAVTRIRAIPRRHPAQVPTQKRLWKHGNRQLLTR